MDSHVHRHFALAPPGIVTRAAERDSRVGDRIPFHTRSQGAAGADGPDFFEHADGIRVERSAPRVCGSVWRWCQRSWLRVFFSRHRGAQRHRRSGSVVSPSERRKAYAGGRCRILSDYVVRCQFAFSLAWDGAGGSCPFRQWMFNISALVAVQLRVPDAIRGRVMGVFAISQSIGLLGGLWTGALAAAIGLRAGMMVGPVVLLVLIFTVFATQRKVRELHEDTVLDG